MKSYTNCAGPQQRKIVTAVAAALSLTASASVVGAELINNDAYTVRWDNTVKYSVAQRSGSPAGEILANANTNDGDYSFKRGGLIMNRGDVLSEFDWTLKDRANTGISISAAAWYDDVYTKSHATIPTAELNTWSVAPNQFSGKVRKINGHDVELLNAFVHSGTRIGDHDLSFRAGRHTLLWGESLMLATNGISAGMGAIDAAKASSLPGATTKEIFMPTNQLSAAFGLTDKWDLQGYYQFEYRETRVTPPGSYFSTADLVFQGAERINLGSTANFGIPVPGNAYFIRGADIRAPEAKGQWGLSAKYRDAETGRDLGLYYLRYTDKTPQIYTQAGGAGAGPVNGGLALGNFFFVYPRDIEIYGVSTATAVGDANVSGEISMRRNMPLVASGLNVAPGAITVNGANDFLHPVGDTLHAQVSWIWSLGPTSLYEAADFVGEIGGHTLLKTTKNEAYLDKTRSTSAFGFAATFEPKWYQALPSIDLTMPINLIHNFSGASKVDPAFIQGISHGGALSVGLKATYQTQWRAAINYTYYYGETKDNPYIDRNYLSANVSYSF